MVGQPDPFGTLTLDHRRVRYANRLSGVTLYYYPFLIPQGWTYTNNGWYVDTTKPIYWGSEGITVTGLDEQSHVRYYPVSNTRTNAVNNFNMNGNIINTGASLTARNSTVFGFEDLSTNVPDPNGSNTDYNDIVFDYVAFGLNVPTTPQL